MSVAANQATRYGGAGAWIASPMRAADPWYCGHGASDVAAAATGVSKAASANEGTTRRRRIRKARHPTHGRCGQRRSAVGPKRREPDQARDRQRPEEQQRVDVGAVQPNAEMQLRHGHLGVPPSGGRDRLASRDVIVLTNENTREPRARARD